MTSVLYKSSVPAIRVFVKETCQHDECLQQNGQEWEEIALYSYYVQNTRMFFVAPLSQYDICHAMSTLSPECVNNDNTPGQAYDSLYIALHYDPEPAQTPPFASDLRATN